MIAQLGGKRRAFRASCQPVCASLGAFEARSTPRLARRPRAAQCGAMLDDRDRKLLTLLQRDAEASVTDLAERVSLSVSACSRRIARLREAGYIARQVAILDRRAMRVPTTVFVMVRTTAPCRGLARRLPPRARRHPRDRRGPPADRPLRLRAQDGAAQRRALRHVYKALVGRVELSDVSASISMETLKDDTALPTGFARDARGSAVRGC